MDAGCGSSLGLHVVRPRSPNISAKPSSSPHSSSFTVAILAQGRYEKKHIAEGKRMRKACVPAPEMIRASWKPHSRGAPPLVVRTRGYLPSPVRSLTQGNMKKDAPPPRGPAHRQPSVAILAQAVLAETSSLQGPSPPSSTSSSPGAGCDGQLPAFTRAAEWSCVIS